MDKVEIRHVTVPVKLEAREGQALPSIVGMPIVFNKRSENLGGFVEEVKPEAVTLGERDVVALYNHDTGAVLGRQSAGTLTLRKDTDGVHMELQPPDTQVGRDTVTSVKRGDISGMSFGFMTRKDRWTFAPRDSNEPDFRELLDIDLREVTITPFPAYPDTSVAVRSMEQAKEAEKPKAEGPTAEQINRQKAAELAAKM